MAKDCLMTTKIVQLKDEEGNNLYPNVLVSQSGSGPDPEGIQIGSLISALRHGSATGSTASFNIRYNSYGQITADDWITTRGGTQTTNVEPYAITITTPADESWTILLELVMQNGIRPKSNTVNGLIFRLYETADFTDYTSLVHYASSNNIYGTDSNAWTFMQPAVVSCIVEIPQNTTTNFLPTISTQGAYFYTSGFYFRATLIDKRSV